MPTRPQHSPIKSVRRQFGVLVLFAALMVVTAFAGAQQTPASQSSATSSKPMDHAGMANMKSHAGMSMTGDVNYDFAVNMRKHHQMGLMMAEAQLRNGNDAKLRAMSTQIIAAQKKEVAALDRWITTRDQAKVAQSKK